MGSIPAKRTWLERLQEAKSLEDLAGLLNFTPSGLAYVLYKTNPSERYRTFEIPKAAGGTRTIQTPNKRLKLAQRRLADLLYNCLIEIEARKPDRRGVSHAFHKKRSIVTNAGQHYGCRYVLNLDLKDFFGTINFGRVRGFFIADSNFRLSGKLATVIAQIACHENALPQGAPCSPVISNLIGHILDARMIRLARTHGCMYTRYADDLTFSTNQKKFPWGLARKRFYFFGKHYVVGHQLEKAIATAGFTVNPTKTRLQFRGSRQMTTGLTVNEKVNICQDYYRDVRSMCSSLFQTGTYYINKDDKAPVQKLAPLEGRLAHIYYVKNVTVRRKHKLDHRLVPYQKPHAPKELYRRFLFFKYFVGHEVPTIVTEGKTDIVYLRTALKALHAKYSDLVTIDDKDEASLAIQFLPATANNIAILNLGQGYSGMSGQIPRYSRDLKRYGFRPLNHPVIFIVDNDEGGKNVIKAGESLTSTKFDQSKGDRFFPVTENLYIVPTPLDASGEPTAIEDCFPQDVLDQELEGKKLNRKKNDGDSSSYGKHIFAEKIVRPGVKTINFSGFEPLLDGVSQAISHYQRKLLAKEVAAKKSA